MFNKEIFGWSPRQAICPEPRKSARKADLPGFLTRLCDSGQNEFSKDRLLAMGLNPNGLRVLREKGLLKRTGKSLYSLTELAETVMDRIIETEKLLANHQVIMEDLARPDPDMRVRTECYTGKVRTPRTIGAGDPDDPIWHNVVKTVESLRSNS